MADTVPYLDENGKKQYLDTKRYIKRELVKELFVRDDISAALSDHSEEGLIPQFVKRVNDLHEKQEQSEKVRHMARGKVDIEAEKRYNKSEIFTMSKEFLREVPSESREAFSRSLANKTSDMQDGEYRLVPINAAGKVYYFAATGYMRGTIIETSTKNINELQKEIRNERSRINEDTEIASLWSESIRNDGREHRVGSSVHEERSRSTSDDRLSREESHNSNRAGYNESGTRYSYTEEELDRVIKTPKRLYGGEVEAIVDRDSAQDYLGEGLQKIIQPIQELGKEQETAFYDYLFHQHNADRMSLERRSIEWNEEKNELKKRVI